MVGRTLDDEILRRRALRNDLGTNAGVAGLQGAILQIGPVATDGSVELVGSVRIHGVVDAVDPLDVGAEFRLTAEIDRDVHAQTARNGNGVDQAREG